VGEETDFDETREQLRAVIEGYVTRTKGAEPQAV